MLSIQDRSVFVPEFELPSYEHVCFVGQIKSLHRFFRIRLEVDDVNNPDADPIVIFYYLYHEEKLFEDSLWNKLAVGHTIVISNPLPHHFLDGTYGFRMETVHTTTIIPATYRDILALEPLMHNKRGTCDVCHKAPLASVSKLQRCGACKVALYDQQECQRSDWPNHKKDCKTLRILRELLEREDEIHSDEDRRMMRRPTSWKAPLSNEW